MVSVTTIFYVIYLIYVVSLFIDWEFIINSEYAIWGLTLVLLTGIFLTTIIGTIYVTSKQTLANVPINGTYLIVILCALLLCFGMIVYYQYYTTNKIKSIIESKLHNTVFAPLGYQYGSDSQEIGIRLRITDNELIPRTESKTLQEIWARLMSTTSENKIREVLKQILGTDLNDSIDVCYDLLWYLCISQNPFGTNLTQKQINYVLQSDVNELRQLLGPNFTGAQDRASLIFTILSGQIIPTTRSAHDYEDETNSHRYEQVKEYPPNIVYNLAFHHNKIIDHTEGTYARYGPYTYLSMTEASAIENIIANVHNECKSFTNSYNILIERLGIGPVRNSDTMTEDEKIIHLQGELSLYNKVFTRDPQIGAPPNLNGLNRNEIMDILVQYMNTELIQAYEPRGLWDSRTELLELICNDVMGGSRWSIHSVLHCNNDDTININTVDRHGDMDKRNRQDPTLSYGVHKNYRCYQAEELADSFTEYDGVFLFRVPDWSPNAIDATTNTALIREFPLESIKQLKTLLEKERSAYNVSGLLEKIEMGLAFMKSAAMKTRHLKQQFDQFTFEQKRTVELYLAWMFTYAMWMRFWKGPGTPWPMVKVNVTRESERLRAQRSSPQERDENIFIQGSVHTAIIEMYEKDPMLKEWIESLSTIYYDFETREASCATHTIKSIIDQIALGDYCMGFGSDTILKTSYYYITALLGYATTFDEFIQRMLPELQDIEYTAVSNQIATITTPGARLQMLNQRLRVLQQPIPRQPRFNASMYQNNTHVD